MGSYIDEITAKEAIVLVVENHTDDYSIHVAKRKAKTPILKQIIFGVKLKHSEDNELLFNEFMKNEITNNKNLNILESEIYLENKALKEIFFISADVSISF